jgi:uncharacterized protein YbaP (TraB family)
MMRRLAILLACLALSACSRTEEPTAPGHPALWRVESADGRAAGWLFGTVHALPANVRWQGPVIDRALSEAGVLVVEVRGIADKDEISRVFKRLADNPVERPLALRVPPDARPRLEVLMAGAGIPSNRFDSMDTWAAATAVAQVMQRGDIAHGADAMLEAQFGKRRIVELEGAEPQLAIFDRLPEKEQRDLLRAVIRESARAEQTADALQAAWLNGDMATLEIVSRQGVLEDPELYEALLAGRNRDWTARIARLLDAHQSPFVAVGAGHMAGKDGLVAMLRAKGYTVRRIQ